LESVTDGRGCYLVGDAAGLPNPLCFGGIGAALISARFAAEAASNQKPVSYARFIERDPMFDRRFMEAHRIVAACEEDEAEDLLKPFRKGYSVPRGVLAMARRPGYARAYFGMWRGFKVGWRVCPLLII
jgi:digeranylgeranylglycerophospholipid reductase